MITILIKMNKILIMKVKEKAQKKKNWKETNKKKVSWESRKMVPVKSHLDPIFLIILIYKHLNKHKQFCFCYYIC